MGDLGSFEERAFPPSRFTTIDWVAAGQRKHHVPVILDLDVTDARERIRRIRERTGEGISFTGWMVRCLGQAVAEHRYVQAMRRGHHLVTFADVDVTVTVERSIGEGSETVPMPYVVRRANAKTTGEIHSEIRAAQSQRLSPGEMLLGTRTNSLPFRLFCALPAYLRYLVVYRRLLVDPFFAKRTMGTVVVTSLGASSRGTGGAWFIPIGLHPLQVALGAIVKKPGVVDDRIKVREYLTLTVLFDHDVTDGAPVARFVQRLKELVESAYGLSE